jgi:hypothetical protein
VRIHRHIGLFGAVLLSAACADSPRVVAERFWIAAQDRDAETLRETSTGSWGDHHFDVDSDTEIGEVTFGQTAVEGDEARVETTLTHIDEDSSVEVSFETVLVRRDGEWRVDLYATTGQLVGSILGTTAREFTDALAEGLGRSLEELADELADGMREMGEAMREAFEETNDGSELKPIAEGSRSPRMEKP